MNRPRPPQAGFARELRAYTKGQQVALYLAGLPKPLRHVTICQVTENCIVARWNSSTHLVPLARVTYVRYEPDSEPCRDRHHTLHHVVNRRWTPSPPRNKGKNQDNGGDRTTAASNIIGAALEQLHRASQGEHEK